MKFFRSERVGSVIQEELGKMISREIELAGGLVTIIDVAVDKKMERARVGVSVLPAKLETVALRLLNMKIGEFQHALNRKMQIRPMPLISFTIDHGYENAAAIEKKLLEEREKEAGKRS